MPAPTAQPQRVAVVGRRPDAGVAKRLLGRGEREAVRAVGELAAACGRRSSSSRKSFTSAAMCTGKPLASNRLIGAPPLRPASSASQVVATSLPTGVTRPMPVIATRRLRRGHARRLRPRRTRARAVATVLPSRRAPSARSSRHAVLGVPQLRRASSSAWPGRDERAHLHVRHPRRHERRAGAPVRRLARERRSRGRSARRAAASPGNTGRRGKWSPKNGADVGHVQRRASPTRRGRRAVRTTRGATTPRKRPGGAPAPRSSSKRAAQRVGRIELLDRQHRAEAVDELDHVARRRRARSPA